LPTYTVAQIASLQAELAVRPAEAAAIRQRYHLRDEASLRRVQQHWQKRFAHNPAERAEYDTLYRQYCAWLESQRGP